METQPYFGYVSTPSLKSTLIINELYFSPWPRPDGSLITRFSRPGADNFTHERPCSVCRAPLFTCTLSSIFMLMAYCSTSPSHGPSSGRWTEDIELGRKHTTVRRNFLRQGFNCLTSITYKAQNIFRLELRNFAVGNKTPSASHEQRKNNLRANYVPH